MNQCFTHNPQQIGFAPMVRAVWTLIPTGAYLDVDSDLGPPG